MLCTLFGPHGLLAIFISCLLFLNPVSTVFEGSDDYFGESDSSDALSVIKDELQNLRMDLTKSFVAEHTRRKRAATGRTEARIAKDNPDLTITIDSSGQTTASFKDDLLIFKGDGIFRANNQAQSAQLEKVSDWTLDQGDTILHTYEWKEQLFILTANKKGSYSRLSTLESPGFLLIRRQQIKLPGVAKAAQFFNHGPDLYLIIAVDNDQHSLTTSPVYRWTRTYMDQIHQIETRGASAVAAFSVNSFKYIAIAQSQDAVGNYQVGTILVRMFEKGEVEKVQLLWSNNPISLKHFRIFHEDYLLIGQAKEASIIYWFGGFDFTYWETEGNFGKSHFLDTITLSDNEPLILSGNEQTVKFITRESSTYSGELVFNQSNTVYTVEKTETLINARFVQLQSGQNYLALTVQNGGVAEIKVFKISTVLIEEGESQVKVPEDKVKSCLALLRTNLDRDAPDLGTLERTNELIITRTKDVNFNGAILVPKSTIVFPAKDSLIDKASVQPDLESPEDKYTLTPSQLLARAKQQDVEFAFNIKPGLDKLLLKSVPGEITGDKTFGKSLIINDLALSKLQLETLNEVAWSELVNQVLKVRSDSSQMISGDWVIGTLKSEKFLGINKIGDVVIDDFLLTTCERGVVPMQSTRADYIFKKDLEFKEGLSLGDAAKINEIKFSDIALRSKLGRKEVGGLKQADFIIGADGFEAFLLNGVEMKKWFNSMLLIDGDEQISTGLKTFSNLKSIDEAKVENINGQNWDEFFNSILLNEGDQTISGHVQCKRLTVTKLFTEVINSKRVDEFLTTDTDQVVTSDISISNVKFKKNLETGTVNGIVITEAVRKTEDAEIEGPVHFRKLDVNDVLVDDAVTISNVDVSEAAKLRKTHTYSTSNSEAIHIRSGEVGANVLQAATLNDVDIEKIKEAFWRLDVQNEIPGDFDFTPAGLVTTGDLTTKTLNQHRLDQDFVTTTGQNEKISSILQFARTVFVEGNVITPDGVTMNKIDFSEVAAKIIRTDGTSDGRHIAGRKHFQRSIDAKNGIKVGRVNDKSLETDFVYLSGVGHQKISAKKKFQEVSAQDVLSTTDIVVDGLVNGHDLQTVRDTTAYSDQPVTIVGDIIFSKSVEAKNLRVENEVNKLSFNDIVAQRIDLSKGHTLAIPLTIREGTLTFKEDSDVNFINKIRLTEYLPKVVNKNSDAVISGAKEFETVIIEGDLDGCRVINGIDFWDLQRFAFSKTSDQIITGKLQFEQVHSTSNIITERIGGILLDNLIQTDKASEIASTVVFQDSETSFQNIQVDGLVNGFKIEEVAAGLKKLSGNRRFQRVTVERNLDWENSHNEFNRLSYLFDNVVTRDTHQTITKRITFSSLKAKSIESEQWINGVDLKFIRDDAVFKNQPAVFTGRNTFTEHLVSVASVLVEQKLDVDFINKVSLRALDKEVVRRDSTDQVITGLKTFEEGFTTENLFVGGSIDNIRTEDIVLKGDERTIERVTLNEVKINGNLDFEKLDGIPSIKDILDQRVSLSEDQTIQGLDFTFDKDVFVDECDASLINDIRDSDLFLKDSVLLQEVRGQKKFQKIQIDGSIDRTSIDGILLDILNSQIFRLNRDEVFERHVIFADTVLVKDLNVTNGINTINFGDMQAQFSTQLKDIVAPIHASEATREKAMASIKSLEESLKNEAFWFTTGLLPSQYLGVPAIRVEHLVNPKENFSSILLHQRLPVGEGEESVGCDLPKGCLCKRIQVWDLQADADVESNTLALKTDEFDGVNTFFKLSPDGIAYRIDSPVTSYNEICTSPSEEGITRISKTSSASVNIVGEVSTGFITDAQVFSSDGTDYIVLSQSYNHRTKSHAVEVLVFAVGDSGLEKVQSLLANGATRIALESKYDGWVLAVANSLDGISPEDCSTDSKIYFWSTEEKLFKEIKSVDTVGAEDVVILNVDQNSQYGDSFVVFAENEGSTDNLEKILGKLTIYGSSGLESSGVPKYALVQTVDFPTPIFSTYAISVRKQSFVLVVTDDSIVYYKYLNAEGFKKWGTVQIAGARDTNVLLWEDQIFFIIASETNSLLAQAKVIGSPVETSKQSEDLPPAGNHSVPTFD